MKSPMGVFCAAVVALGSFCSFGADTPPEGVDLTDLTSPDMTGTHVTTTATGSWVKPAKNAFDNGTAHDNNDRSICGGTTVDWIYTFDKATKVDAYKVFAPGKTPFNYDKRMPKNWTFQGKMKTDADWTTLDTRTDETGWSALESRYFQFENTVKYDSYRFAVTANNGGDNYIQIDELEFYNLGDYTVTSPSLTLQDNGSWLLTGTFKDVAEGSVKLVATPTSGSAVEVDLGSSYAKGDSLAYSFTAASAGLPTSSFCTAKIVVPDGASGTETALAGRYSFGGYATSVGDFSHTFTVTPSADVLTQIGEATYSDFPVLLRLSSDITNFDATVSNWDGDDMMILDENETALSFEVENWDAAGVSLVWVKVPTLSASTTFTCYLGAQKPGEKSATSSDVWSDYVGVWHFKAGEAGGTTASDSTGHGLDGTTTTAFTSYDGPFGGSALNNEGTVLAPDYEPSYNVGATFTASGWFKCPNFTGTSGAYNTFVSKKVGLSWNATSGWYIQMSQSKTKAGVLLSATEYKSTIPDVTQNWNYYTLVSDGSTVKLYWNGSTTPAVNQSYAVVANSTSYQIGGVNSCEDEFRLRKGAASAAEMALEYATMANTNFFAYGEVEQVDTSVPVIAIPTVESNADGTFTVSAAISVAAPAADSVVCVVGDTSYPMTGSGIGTYTVKLNNLATGTYMCSVQASATSGTVVEKACPTVFYSGTLTVVKVRDADEATSQSAIVRLSRAAADQYPFTVNYTVASDTATAGVHYVAPSGVATIPAGETSVDVELTPILTGTLAADATVSFTFETADTTSATADQVQDVQIVRCTYDLTKRYVDCTVSGGGSRLGTDWEDAYSNITDAVTSIKTVNIPATIYVKAGTYPVTSQLVLDSASAIVGVEDDPAKVTISNTTKYVDKNNSVNNRVIKLNHASALLANVTVTGGQPYGDGLNILIDTNGGTVSNCISKAAILPYYSVSGSVYLNGANALLTHSIVDGVTATCEAAYWDKSGSVLMKRGVGVHVAKGRVENTLVKDAAAGTAIDSTKVTVKVRVGGMYVAKDATALNCTVVNCSGALAGGIYAANGAMVTNCVAADCYTKGIWTVGGDVVSTLNAITNEVGATIANCATDEATALNDTCVIGTTNTFFTAYSGGDLSPKVKGPLHNAGATPTGWAKGDGRVDLAGNARFVGKAVDIGAYEQQRVPGLVISYR